MNRLVPLAILIALGGCNKEPAPIPESVKQDVAKLPQQDSWIVQGPVRTARGNVAVLSAEQSRAGASGKVNVVRQAYVESSSEKRLTLAVTIDCSTSKPSFDWQPTDAFSEAEKREIEQKAVGDGCGKATARGLSLPDAAKQAQEIISKP